MIAAEFVSFLQAVFFFIELVIYKRICNALISDCPSNDQKCDNKDNLVLLNYPVVLRKPLLSNVEYLSSLVLINYFFNAGFNIITKYNR